jgi:hypothetical protein
MHVPSGGTRLANIRELLIMVFQHLDCTDLLRAQSVSHFWNVTVLGTPSLKPFLFKRAQTTDEEDPLFEHPNNDLIGHSAPHYVAAFQHSHNALVQFLDYPRPKIHMSRFVHAGISVPYMYTSPTRLPSPTARMRYVEGLSPTSVRQFHCVKCWTFHNPVLTERVHPLLHRILNQAPFCLKGFGSRLVLTLDLGERDATTILEVKESIKVLSDVCTVLKGVCADLQSHRLEKDVLTRPRCSQLVVTDHAELLLWEDKIGAVTIGDAVELSVYVCCQWLVAAKEVAEDFVFGPREIRKREMWKETLGDQIEQDELKSKYGSVVPEIDRLLLLFRGLSAGDRMS